MNTQYYDEKITLDRLTVGERGVLAEISAEHPLFAQLTALGWHIGSEILCVRISPAGDPVAFRTAGVTVALRRCDAHGISVRIPASRAGAGQENGKDAEPEDECIPGAYEEIGDLAEWQQLVCGDTYESAR